MSASEPVLLGSTPNIVGVFSHGGVRLPAYVGAYEEAVRRGVRFSHVVGTSGGAIIAAFIAAGMTPGQMTDLLTSGEDFYDQIAVSPDPLPVSRRPLFASAALAVLDRVVGRRLSAGIGHGIAHVLPKTPMTRLMRSLGIFGWRGLDSVLRSTLLRHCDATRRRRSSQGVTFADLRLPLTVIAADLATGSHKVWTRTDTPDADVARAVTSSCLVPILFQPLAEDGHLYVDGGILSYCTLLLLSHARQKPGAESILRFVLETRLPPWHLTDRTGLLSLLSRTVATVIAWERGLPEILGVPIPTIAIPIEGVSPLDLKINRQTRKALHEAGRKAASSFFDGSGWFP
jgi:predicted acylesterase/phospholipase RssA